MHLTTFLLAGAASLVAAQANTSLPTPTSTAGAGGSTCQAQLILDTCVSQLQPQIASCAGNDWSCLCQQYGNLLTCYDNCPGDPARFGVSQQKTQNCGAASAYGTTTLMVASSTTSRSMSSTSSATSGTSASTSAASGSGSGSGTASGSAASATRTGAAAPLSVEVTGGVLAVVAAGFGLFL